jgi:hypothetical protein
LSGFEVCRPIATSDNGIVYVQQFDESYLREFFEHLGRDVVHSGSLSCFEFVYFLLQILESEGWEAGDRVNCFGQFRFYLLVLTLVMWGKHVLKIVGEKVRLVLICCRP